MSEDRDDTPGLFDQITIQRLTKPGARAERQESGRPTARRLATRTPARARPGADASDAATEVGP